MAVISTRDYRSKKDFAAALEKAAGFDRFVVVDPRGAQGDVRGSWSTDRMARGENATLAMYMAVASKMAELDFRKFVEISGRFVVTAAKKAESDAGRNGKPSYYTEWRTRDGEEYYIFRSLGNAAKYEQLWDWADGMGAELRLSYLAGGEAPESAEESAAEADEEAGGGETVDEKAGDSKLPRVTARNCSVVTKDGKLCLYDNDAEKFITIPWDDAEGGVSEMLEFEPVRDTVNKTFSNADDDDADVGDDGDGDLADDDDADIADDGDGAEQKPEGELLGYRYRLEKDGPWGFISRCFSQSLSPRFSEFLIGDLQYYSAGEPQLWSWSTRECETMDGEEITLLELWYAAERETQREGQSDLVLNSAFTLAKGWYAEVYKGCSEEGRDLFFISNSFGAGPFEFHKPYERPFFRVIENERVNQEGCLRSSILYAPSSSGICFALSYTRRGNERNLFSNLINAEDGHKIVRNYGYDSRQELPFLGWADFWDEKASFRTDDTWLEKLPWYEADDLAYLGGKYYYAVCRDGYWAVKNFNRNRLLTPYAFTRINPLEDQNNKTYERRQFFRLERFGKRGVLSVDFWDYAGYPVPCEYESIELKIDNGDDLPELNSEHRLLPPDLEGRFLVSRMGFTGELDLNGKWLVHLHREEAAQEENQDKGDERPDLSDFTFHFSDLFENDGEDE